MISPLRLILLRLVQSTAARLLSAGSFSRARRFLSAYNALGKLGLQQKPFSLGSVLKAMDAETLFRVYSGRGSVHELEQYLLCLSRDSRRMLFNRMIHSRQYHAAYRIVQKDAGLRRETLKLLSEAKARETVDGLLLMWTEAGDPARLVRDLSGPPFAGGTGERVRLWLEGRGIVRPSVPGMPSSAGPYRILREAGRGPAGIVYEAEDTRNGARCALRRIWHDLTAGDEARERLRAAALRAAALDHPSIIPLYDIFELNGFFWLVSGYFDGETLAARLARDGALPLADVRRFMRQICDAVDYAHAHGVIHGAIKPSNILLASDGTVRIADFGMSLDPGKKLDDGNDAALYRAPGLRGQPQDSRGDIYATGIILYEMLTGDLPFRASRASGLRPEGCSTSVAAGLSHAAEGIIATCLRAEREQRDVSARDLATVIETL